MKKQIECGGCGDVLNVSKVTAEEVANGEIFVCWSCVND